MKLKPRGGKQILEIPGARLPKNRFHVPESDIEELLQRLDVESNEEDTQIDPEDDFIPQQQLPKQQS